MTVKAKARVSVVRLSLTGKIVGQRCPSLPHDDDRGSLVTS